MWPAAGRHMINGRWRTRCCRLCGSVRSFTTCRTFSASAAEALRPTISPSSAPAVAGSPARSLLYSTCTTCVPSLKSLLLRTSASSLTASPGSFGTIPPYHPSHLESSSSHSLSLSLSLSHTHTYNRVTPIVDYST